MEFTFATDYNQKTMAEMARALRKTTRKKKNRRTHFFGWCVVVLGLILSFPFREGVFQFSVKTGITWLAVLCIVIVLVWEDAINGYLVWKRNIPGLIHSTTTFTADGYRSVTEVGTSEFPYENISLLAETKDYFVLAFGRDHAQIYLKSSLTGGTMEDFRTFIQEMTGKTITQV